MERRSGRKTCTLKPNTCVCAPGGVGLPVRRLERVLVGGLGQTPDVLPGDGRAGQTLTRPAPTCVGDTERSMSWRCRPPPRRSGRLARTGQHQPNMQPCRNHRKLCTLGEQSAGSSVPAAPLHQHPHDARQRVHVANTPPESCACTRSSTPFARPSTGESLDLPSLLD